MPDASTAPATRPAASGRGKAPLRLWRIGDDEAPPPSGDFVALVPGTDAPLLALTLPEALKGAAREGVAFRQVRDRLGAGAETLELRPARLKGLEQRWSAVLVTERSTLAQWRAVAARGKGRCRAILPDYLALPAAPGLWTLATEVGPNAMMVQARLGPQDGFSAEVPLARHLIVGALERARAQGALPVAVLRLGPAEPALDTALQDLPVVRSGDALPPGLSRPAIMAHGEDALDLARDPRASAEALHARLAGLRWPLALAFVGLLAWVTAIEVQTRRDLALAAAIDAATIDAIRRDFLPSGPLLDIPVQIMRELEQRSGAGTVDRDGRAPMDLLHQAAALVSAHPVQLQSFVMQPTTGITLDLSLDDFGALDRLVADMRAQGLAARTMRSGTEPDDRISATILIEPEG